METNQGIGMALTNSKYTLLADIHGVSVYQGKVLATDAKKGIITFEVIKDKYNNPDMAAGRIINIKSNGINVYDFDKTYATVWVNSDGELVDIVLDKNISVKY